MKTMAHPGLHEDRAGGHSVMASASASASAGHGIAIDGAIDER